MALARRLAKGLRAGAVLALSGPLGSGKTTFIRGLLWGLRGRRVPVRSPTFTLLHIYPGHLPVFHFDWFRLERPRELERVGFFDLDLSGAITVIEWADRFPKELPPERWDVRFSHLAPSARRIVIQPPRRPRP